VLLPVLLDIQTVMEFVGLLMRAWHPDTIRTLI
jgi:hypothetical protein